MRSPQEILEELKQVKYPGLSRDIVSFNFVKDIEVRDQEVSVSLMLTSKDPAILSQIQADVKKAVEDFTGAKRVEIKLLAPFQKTPQQAGMEGVKSVIAVGSGKGGVGKSTVSVNLAIALQETGARVGLMDADVYGPSLPTLLGGPWPEPKQEEGKLLPLMRYSVKMMSMGLLATEDTPVIWRGPMASKLIQQFLGGVRWEELDYLVIDLPPGTGDIQLTLTQSAPLTGAIIVTTPQDVAVNIARKGLRMFQQVKVPILGIVENMSYFECPHCHGQTHIFRRGGGKKVAAELGIPLLGEIPLDPEIADGGDEGIPIMIRNPSSLAAQAYRAIARSVRAQIEGEQEAASFRPIEVKYLDDTHLGIQWSDGHQSVYSFHHLRFNCPCAECVDEWTGQRRITAGHVAPDIRPRQYHIVGNYALEFQWSDGHYTGIYDFERLRRLCQCPQCLN